MSKFKVGDKIVCVHSAGWDVKGREGIVIDVDGSDRPLVDFGDDIACFQPGLFCGALFGDGGDSGSFIAEVRDHTQHRAVLIFRKVGAAPAIV